MTHGHRHSDRIYMLIQSNVYIYELQALSQACSLFWEVSQHVRRIPTGCQFFMPDTGSKTIKEALTSRLTIRMR